MGMVGKRGFRCHWFEVQNPLPIVVQVYSLVKIRNIRISMHYLLMDQIHHHPRHHPKFDHYHVMLALDHARHDFMATM
jgi:hypothetical protein